MSVAATTMSNAEPDEWLLRELGNSEVLRSVLDVVCRTTGMGFAAVACVTASRWIACQVRDDCGFGVTAGGELPVKNTLCNTIRDMREAIVIDNVAADHVYCHHPVPAAYRLQSYIGVPIILQDGELFGTLCAIDRAPRHIDAPKIRSMFTLFAQLISAHIEARRLSGEGRALRDNHAFLTSLLDVSPDWITVLSLDGRIEFVNEHGLALQQSAKGVSMLGAPFISLWPQEERRKVQLAVDAAIAGRGGGFEAYGPTAHGEPRWWDARFCAFRQPGGALKLMGVFRDVSRCVISEQARQQASIALQSLNETMEKRVTDALAEKKVYADVVEMGTAAVTVLDPQWRILAINWANANAFEHVYGKRPLIGDHFLNLFDHSPEDREQQFRIWSRALSGESFAIVQEFGDVQLERRWYEVRFSPLLSRNGQLIGATSTSYDVSDRVRAQTQLASAQEQLRQAQKVEAMGQLTGSVAHDFNNLLTPIVGTLDLMKRRARGDAREQRLINAAMQSAERARHLVQRLLAFARRQPLQPTAINLASVVRGMAELIRSTLGPQIQLVLELAEDISPASADPNQLEMALLNLSVNARDAMSAGGVLRISVGESSVAADQVAGLPSGVYSCLSVADTGSGMDELTLARAVEPFFSTKGVGKGTGLGLSMVDALARQLGGALKLHSQAGQGTRVELWLPTSPAVLEPSIAGESDTAEAARGAGLVLLVDDEDLVRLSTAEMLSELGYVVEETISAEQALVRIHAGLTPDLVVTDHLMPGMTGMDLARVLATEYPDIAVLIVSGYADVQGVSAGYAVLGKPFRRDELAAIMTALRTR